MKEKIGYLISGLILVIFMVLSSVLNFNSSNTVWALAWMGLAGVTAFGTTIRNFKNSTDQSKKIIYAMLLVPLSCMMFGLILLIFFVLFKVIQIPLY